MLKYWEMKPKFYIGCVIRIFLLFNLAVFLPVIELRAQPDRGAASAMAQYKELVRRYNEVVQKLGAAGQSEDELRAISWELRLLRTDISMARYNLADRGASAAEIVRNYDNLLRNLATQVPKTDRAAEESAWKNPKERWRKDFSAASELLARSSPSTPEAEAAVLDEVLKLIAEHKGQNINTASIVEALALRREALRTPPGTFNRLASSLTSIPVSELRSSPILREFQTETFKRTLLFSPALRSEKISALDAAAWADAVKYTLQFVDDVASGGNIMDPNAASAVTNLLTRFSGFVKLGAAGSDPNARQLVDGIRDLADLSDAKIKSLGIAVLSQLRAFEISADMTAAIVDTSKNGVVISAKALEDIALAMGGDPHAAKRLPEHARMLESTISRENYGKAMFKSYVGRFIDQMPFARSLNKFYDLKTTAPARTTEAQTHEEIYRGRNGSIIKHFIWTFTPVITRSGETIGISFSVSAKKPVDNFAGVAGEIGFSGCPNGSIIVGLSDGRSIDENSGALNVKATPGVYVVGILAKFECEGRQWEMSW